MALLLCACPEVEPITPEIPDEPENPDPPVTPEEKYFRLKRYNFNTGFYDLEPPTLFVFDHTGQDFVSLMVETNVDDWTVTSTEPWCKPVKGGGMLAMSADPYGSAHDQLYPRSCEVRIKAGNVYEGVIKVGQESCPFIYTPRYKYEYFLPASGASLDIFVVTSLYDWQIKNENAWLKAEKINRTTLRVSSVPDASAQKRSGEIVLFSVGDSEPHYSRRWTLKLTEGDPDLTGEGYEYGNNLGWD